MSMIPGINAKHAVVTQMCVLNRGFDGAIIEALDRLHIEALECAKCVMAGGKLHFVLATEWPEERANG